MTPPVTSHGAPPRHEFCSTEACHMVFKLVTAQFVLVAQDIAGEHLQILLLSTWLRNMHRRGIRMPSAMALTVLRVT